MLAVTITASIAFYATGSVELALSVGVIDTLIKLVVFYGFDITWNKIMNREFDPKVIWITGLSGAGKTTLGLAVKEQLKEKGHTSMLLDGDLIRGLFPTGFDAASRENHALRVAQLAAIIQSQGVTAIVTLITPYQVSRDRARELCGNYMEVYLSTSLAVCEERDVKGLYKKVRAGEIKNFTGIDDPYETPIAAEITLDTSLLDLKQCAIAVLEKFKGK